MNIFNFFRRWKVRDALSLVHPDIKELIWVKNGKYKNYDNAMKKKCELEALRLCGTTLNFTLWAEEPSLIDETLPVIFPDARKVVPRPPYSPSYSKLTPEQRGIYLEFLKNPYDATVDIGYVFVLYYGLERHLLLGNIDLATDVILKLRDVHINKSFQQYSAKAVLLCNILKDKDENITKFSRSLDKEHEFLFSHNLFLFCTCTFNSSLTSWGILRMSRTFEFTNQNYIKKYPELFYKHLEDALTLICGKNELKINEYFTIEEVQNLQREGDLIFANLSLTSELIFIPKMCEHPQLKEVVTSILREAHEATKKELAVLRKEGVIQVEVRKETKKIEFNPEIIEQAFEDYKKKIDGFVNTCKRIRDFHENFPVYINMLENAKKIEKTDISLAIAQYLEILKMTTPTGSTYWERPMILLEKIKMYDKALFICERAVIISTLPGVRMGEFVTRLLRLRKKCGVEIEDITNQ